jgi:hypothetical protein
MQEAVFIMKRGSGWNSFQNYYIFTPSAIAVAMLGVVSILKFL